MHNTDNLWGEKRRFFEDPRYLDQEREEAKREEFLEEREDEFYC